MLSRALRIVVWVVAFSAAAGAQQRAPIEGYIHTTWDTLTRSMSECKSVVDTKVTTAPILYLPAGMETPSAVAAMQAQCKLQVEHLPRAIGKMGDVKPSEFPKNGLLYLPNPYVVPGGRFNEMYGWDTYFILMGLISDHRLGLAKGIVENFFFEIENYGAILNANRTYFLTRSQPPFLSSMIREVYEGQPASAENDAWLAKAYEDATRDYSLWTSPAHQAGTTGLARYIDLGAGPVPEMADDSTYYPDVIRWLLAHPAEGQGYLMEAPDSPTDEQAAALATTSCDVKALKVCAAAHVDGHRLTAAYYRGDRAMRESGFDTSFRFGPFSGSTDQYAPVCLNSLLYKYETDMEHFATLLHRKADAAMWAKRAAARKEAINRYLWDKTKSIFSDYDYVNKKTSDYHYVTSFYPLWAKLVTPAQAAAMETQLPLFEHDGGLAMSDKASGTQWDLPFGWAPTNWLTVSGLTQYGDTTDALRIAKSFTQTIGQNYTNDGTLREKYNVVSGSANVAVSAGYKMNVIGFGWTNGVYLRMRAMIDAAPAKP